jgi:hypothetical protein
MSMSRFQFELATPNDDADLRRILASTPMPGRIAVSLRREPNWFAAAVVDGYFRQVVTCRNLDTGLVVGFGCRSIRRLYVNGHLADVGYLSSLRLLSEFRKLGLIARGYAFFRRLHEDGRAPFYLTTIAEGNNTAIKLLTSGRAQLPAYRFTGRYHTIALTLSRRRFKHDNPAGVKLSAACDDDLPAILELLATEGPRRQFFPHYELNDFLCAEGKLRGLQLESVIIARRGGRLLGLLAGWDQHAYRQSTVDGYSGWVGRLRPLYNGWQRLRGLSGLPPPGQPLRCLTAAIPLVVDNDPQLFAALIGELRRRHASGSWSHLLIGLHETDPLLPVAQRFAARSYTTFLYLVGWQDSDAARAALDQRPVYLELGTL